MTDRPKPVDIDAIDELTKGTSALPWQLELDHEDTIESFGFTVARCTYDEDAALLVALRNAWPTIAKELREARARIQELETHEKELFDRHHAEYPTRRDNRLLRAENEKLRAEVEGLKERMRYLQGTEGKYVR